MTRAGILRELAAVQALRLVIERRKMLRSQQLAFLAAMRVSGKMAVKGLELEKNLHTALEK